MPERGGEGRFGGKFLKRELLWPGPNAEFNVDVDLSFNQWDLVVTMHSMDAGGFWGFSLVVVLPYLYDRCSGWKFPHVTVWALSTVIQIPSCGWLAAICLIESLETFTQGTLPVSLNLPVAFLLNGEFWEVCMCVGFFRFEYISHSQQQILWC